MAATGKVSLMRSRVRAGVSRLTKHRVLLARSGLALPLFAGVVGSYIWAIKVSLEEERVDPFTNTGLFSLDPKSYRVVVESVDEISGRIQIRAELRLEESRLFFNEATRALAQQLEDTKQKPRFFVGPFALEDQAENFYATGLFFVPSRARTMSRLCLPLCELSWSHSESQDSIPSTSTY